MPVFSRFWFDQQGRTDAEQLRMKGPVLQVEISLPTALANILQRQGQPLTTPHIGLALIDTGASITGVDQAVLTQLGLTPTGVAPVATPGGVVQQPLYACNIGFPGTTIPMVPFSMVIGCQLATLGYSALLGRDLLRSFHMVYNGVEGLWTLSF